MVTNPLGMYINNQRRHRYLMNIQTSSTSGLCSGYTISTHSTEWLNRKYKWDKVKLVDEHKFIGAPCLVEWM